MKSNQNFTSMKKCIFSKENVGYIYLSDAHMHWRLFHSSVILGWIPNMNSNIVSDTHLSWVPILTSYQNWIRCRWRETQSKGSGTLSQLLQKSCLENKKKISLWLYIIQWFYFYFTLINRIKLHTLTVNISESGPWSTPWKWQVINDTNRYQVIN